MGTNYYIKADSCEKCGRSDGDIHLGKSSAGWQFSFQYNGGQYYKNVKEMKAWTKDKVIYDEYDAPVQYEDFWKMVKAKQKKSNLNHAEYVKENHPSHTDNFVIDGYSFSDCEFS